MKTMILDPRTSNKIIYNAEKLGFKVLLAPEISGIDASVSGHPDMQIVCIEDNIIVNPASYKYFQKHLRGKNVICGKTEVQGKYPEYTAYNVALCGNYALHNFKYTDPVVFDALCGFKKINVKQSYTKCSVVTTPLGIITADKGIINTVNKTGLNCIEISQDDISLSGKEYGFLGGASGYSDGVLYFSGDITIHKDYEKIKKFCSKTCIEILCLSNDKLADIGSIIII